MTGIWPWVILGGIVLAVWVLVVLRLYKYTTGPTVKPDPGHPFPFKMSPRFMFGSIGLISVAGPPLLIIFFILFSLIIFGIENLPSLSTFIIHLIPQSIVTHVVPWIVVMVGSILFAFKGKHQFWYGLLEVAFAAGCCSAALPKVLTPSPDLAAWATLAATVYVCVRGLENMNTGRGSSRFINKANNFLAKAKSGWVSRSA